MEDLKVSELMKLASVFSAKGNSDNSLWVLNEKYFIRTVTMHLVGRLEKITDKELLLSNASWVADSGRFHVALEKGTLDEVEVFPNDVIVNRDSIVDATVWSHSLPDKSK